MTRIRIALIAALAALASLFAVPLVTDSPAADAQTVCSRSFSVSGRTGYSSTYTHRTDLVCRTGFKVYCPNGTTYSGAYTATPPRTWVVRSYRCTSGKARIVQFFVSPATLPYP